MAIRYRDYCKVKSKKKWKDDPIARRPERVDEKKEGAAADLIDMDYLGTYDMDEETRQQQKEDTELFMDKDEEKRRLARIRKVNSRLK